jgi:hypothetical protein
MGRNCAPELAEEAVREATHGVDSNKTPGLKLIDDGAWRARFGGRGSLHGPEGEQEGKSVGRRHEADCAAA